MGLLGNLTVQLGLSMGAFTAGLSTASTQLNNFANSTARSFQSMNSAAGSAGNSINVFSKSASSSFKDISRIAQGIIVSQTFYKMVNAVQSAGSALTNFSMNCEDAKVSFSLLMKDGDKAGKFMEYLQDFAARTPYTMEQAITNARKLLAYGFSPENMNPLLTTISDAASASGDKETFDRVARALGQIKTKGKLAAQELLQLTEAGIPAFEILRDKLHLTSDQLANIGKQKIPADIAINAILKGMQERYGGAGAAISNTMRGMLSTIKDDALIIGSTAFAPFYNGVKAVVQKLRDMAEVMKTTLRNTGFGGLMQSIIPPDMLPKIQLLVANLEGLAQSFARLTAAMGPIISAMLEFGINVLNMVLPIVQIFAQVISYLAQAFSSCTPAVRQFVAIIGGIFIAAACISLLLGLAKAVQSLFIVKVATQLVLGLAKAISILSMAIIRNPWIALLGIGAGALMYFAMGSKTVSNAMQGLGGKISSAFGNDPSKVFTPKMKDNNAQADTFNKNLSVSKDKLDKMGDAAKNAGKKASEALMSFDEVFNLKDQDSAETAGPEGGGDIGDIGDVGAPEIPAIDVPDAEYPDPTEGIQSYFDNFVNTFKERMKSTLIGAGLGALLGALIGGLLFGPEGAKWGALLGAGIGGIIGYFWDQLTDKQKWMVGGAGAGAAIGAIIGAILTGGNPIGIAVGALLGGGIGALIGNYFADLTSAEKWGAGIGGGAGAIIGGIIGTLICPGIGTVVGALLGGGIGIIVGKWWADLSSNEKWMAGGGAGIGATIGAIIGTILLPGWGTAIGAILGGGIGAIVGKYWSDMTSNEQWSAGVGTTAGMTIGAIIGTLICPGLGTVIGMALGGVIGLITGKWWSDLSTEGQWTAGGTSIGAIIGGIIGTIICPGLGTALGAALGGGLGAIVGKYWEDIKGAFMSDSGQGAIVGGIVGGLIAGPIGMAIGAALGGNYKVIEDWTGETAAKFAAWWDETNTGFTQWQENNRVGFANWVSTTGQNIKQWADDCGLKISTWWTDTKTGFSNWWNDTSKGFGTWWDDTKKGFGDWKDTTWKNLGDWVTDTHKAFDDWRTNNATAFGTWWGDTKKGFDDWKTTTGTNITTWATETGTKFATWSSETGTKISTWWADSKTGFSTWYTTTSGNVSSWYTDTVKSINSWYTESSSKMSTWWEETKKGFADWGADAWKSVNDYFTKIIDKIGTAITKVKDFFKAKDTGTSSSDDSAYDSGGSGSSDDSFDTGAISMFGGFTQSLGARFMGDMGLGEMAGHATGGIFNKEHVARFAEGNKAEAIIPLENDEAMQPFVDAVASSVTNALANANAKSATSTSDTGYIMENHYEIGMLIADDNGLRKLKAELKRIDESDASRRG